MTRITLEQANAVIDGALAKGKELGLAPLTVAVTDAGGHVIALQRQDGSSLLRPQIASAKACGALGVGVSSRKIAEMAADRPTFVAMLGELATQGILPAAGGVIVVDSEGFPVGAVGVTGDTSDNDERAAIAGVAAAGLKARG
ncbi:MAG: heme-binding protein [Novosphingobium sp.]|nr:heme-binding protein [Novosphingobium sp.]